MGVAIIQQVVYHGSTWSRVMLFVAFTLSIYMVLTLLEFIFRLLLFAPVAIFKDQQQALDERKVAVLSALEQNRRNVVQQTIDAASDKDAMRDVLLFLLQHGETPRHRLTSRPGFAPAQLRDAISRATQNGILAERIDPSISIHEERFSVKPELRAAVQFCLLGE